MPTKNRIKLEHLRSGLRVVSRRLKGQKNYTPRYATVREHGSTMDRWTHRSRDYVKLVPDVPDGPLALHTYYLDTLNAEWQLAEAGAPPRPRMAVRVTLQEHELAHVLAGLRLLQGVVIGQRLFSYNEITPILNSGGHVLSADEIEALCQRINTAPEVR